jgi:hypothetical protein
MYSVFLSLHRRLGPPQTSSHGSWTAQHNGTVTVTVSVTTRVTHRATDHVDIHRPNTHGTNICTQTHMHTHAHLHARIPSADADRGGCSSDVAGCLVHDRARRHVLHALRQRVLPEPRVPKGLTRLRWQTKPSEHPSPVNRQPSTVKRHEPTNETKKTEERDPATRSGPYRQAQQRVVRQEALEQVPTLHTTENSRQWRAETKQRAGRCGARVATAGCRACGRSVHAARAGSATTATTTHMRRQVWEPRVHRAALVRCEGEGQRREARERRDVGPRALRWVAQQREDLLQLLYLGGTRQQRFAHQQLAEDAADGPITPLGQRRTQ